MRAQFSGKGSGTTDDPYLITTANELNQTRNNLEACYKLMRDIDLTEWLSENNPSQGWMPVGAKDEPFKGTFDGNGKTLKLFINRPDQENVGFMGVVDRATIKNLTVRGNITGKTAVGGIIGYCNGLSSPACEIENCHYVGNVNGGGIVGKISYYSAKSNVGPIATIKNCSFTGKAEAGIVYRCEMVYIQGCKVNATIESEDAAGGIIGIIYPGIDTQTIDIFSEVHDCSVSGHIKGQNAGGIVGSSKSIKIYNNLVTADVEGTNAGGVLGGNYCEYICTFITKNVVASAQIKGAQRVGRVSGTWDAACGKIGTQSTNYVINGLSVYLDGQKQTISDNPQNGEICGKSVLAESATYEGLGWDMKKTWGMSSVTDLPYLLCMGENAGADDETASPDNYDNTLMFGDLTTAAGKEVVLPIKMKNTCDISAYQFDLYLPEGFTVAVDEDGMEKIEVGSRTTSRRHVIDCAKQKDGSVRVMSYSMKNALFKGEHGAVAEITVKAAGDLKAGTYQIKATNVVLSGKDAVAVYPPVTVATALAGNGGEGALALVGSYDEATLSDFSDALSANTSITSVNLKGAYNVEQASLTSGNPNMLVFVGDGVKMNNVANVVENGICANLKLDENYAYSSPFAFTAQQATFNRSFTAGKKSTVYLPFSVDNPQSYGTFFAFERFDAEQGQVYFQEASQLAANTAYVFKPAVETLTFANVEVASTPANQSEVTEAGLYGTFVPVTTPVKLFDGMNVYGYAANDIPAQGIQAGQFVKAGNKVSVASFRSFLALPALQSPRSVGCLFSGETTGIDSVVKENGSDVLYNLKGQRVNQAGKGMYIKNGKKVIVK